MATPPRLPVPLSAVTFEADAGLPLWKAFVLALLVELLLLLPATRLDWKGRPRQPDTAVELRVVRLPEEPPPPERRKLQETPPPPEELSKVLKRKPPSEPPSIEPPPAPADASHEPSAALETAPESDLPGPVHTPSPPASEPGPPEAATPSPQLPGAQLASKSAGPIKKPKPIYPRNALKMGIGGRVVARLTVGEDGRVEHATIVESAPKNVFDKAALDAVKQYEFLPEGNGFLADQEIIFQMGEDE